MSGEEEEEESPAQGAKWQSTVLSLAFVVMCSSYRWSGRRGLGALEEREWQRAAGDAFFSLSLPHRERYVFNCLRHPACPKEGRAWRVVRVRRSEAGSRRQWFVTSSNTIGLSD